MGDFFAELRRRHIYRIGAGYVIVAWAIAQVVDLLSQIFALPDWIAQPIVIVLAVGFPITLIAAWLIEGKAHEAVVSAVRSPATTIDYVLAGGLVLVLGVFGYQKFAPRTETVAVSTANAVADGSVQDDNGRLRNSIAVLPFENLSPDPDNAYFAAGIHEEVLNQLAKINDLNVIARTSVLQYPGSGKTIVEIADELNVEMVMEGSVRYGGDQVRVAAQLIDGATNAHLWTEAYDGDLSDIFAIQADIANRIALALEADVLPAERESIETPLTNSTEALTLYLRAKTSISDLGPALTPEEVSLFHGYMDQAIEADPNFALAYAFKAYEYAFSMQRPYPLSEPNALAIREQLVREYAEKALAIDPSIGQAYAALGYMEVLGRRWREAGEAWDRAYALSPNDLDVAQDYAWYLSAVGRTNEAASLAQHSIELAPNRAQAFMVAGLSHLFFHDYEMGLELIRRASALDQNLFSGHLWGGLAQAALGNNEDALAEFRRAEILMADIALPDYLSVLAYGYGRIGRRDDAMRVFPRIQDLSAEFRVGFGSWAAAYLGIGDQANALANLRMAADHAGADEGFEALSYLAVNLAADPVLEQPEFSEVRNQLWPRP